MAESLISIARGWVVRALTPTDVSATVVRALGFAGDEPPQYSPTRAMSTIAQYPWARVGALAVAADLSGIPMVVSVGRRWLADEEEHWAKRLLARPDHGWSGVRWRRQMVADFRATGNAFARVHRDSTGRPYRLQRIHGERIAPIAKDGELLAWRLDGAEVLSVADVLHVADISWQPTSVLGEAPARALDTSTQAAIAARRQAGIAARRGRLEMMITSREAMGQRGVEQIVAAFTEATSSGSGVFVSSRGLTAQPLSLSPRDTEWSELDLRTRDETLAVHGVPPVRAQLPSANYGAAKQEMRQYWESSCMRTADLFDAELSYILDPSGQVQVAHSFEKVEALQTSYTERLARVGMWVANGADPRTAAEYELFRMPPLAPGAQPRGASAPPPSSAQVDTPQARSWGAVMLEVARSADECVLAGYDVDQTADVLRAPLMQLLGGADATELALELAETAHAQYESTGEADCASLLGFQPDTARAVVGA